MATNQSKKLRNFRIGFQDDAEFKTKYIQDRMQTVTNVLTAARNKPATNDVIIDGLLRMKIMITLQGMTEKLFSHLPMFRPRRRTQTSELLLQQNHQFPIDANLLLLIVNFVMRSLQF